MIKSVAGNNYTAEKKSHSIFLPGKINHRNIFFCAEIEEYFSKDSTLTIKAV